MNNPVTAAAEVPRRVGVYGGGRMGAGIAHAFAVVGADVVVVETGADTAAAARGRVSTSLAKAAARGIEATGSVEVLTDPTALVDAECVIEAVPEVPALKTEVLRAVEKIAPNAVLATNTSSLSVADLAVTLNDPSRLIGLHFFNPVPASDLVEIVVASTTAPELVVRAQGWVAGLGKTAITVADSPGFASSRLGVGLALEAMRMLDEGVATAADIDTAMTLGYRHPVGPLRTTDIVGLDVRLAVAEYLTATLGPRFEPPKVLRDKVAAGRLGRKTGQGFYSW